MSLHSHHRRAVTRPTFLERRGTDEYQPPPYTAADRRVIAASHAVGTSSAKKHAIDPEHHWASRLGTAAGLRALNAEWGEEFYRVPPEAVDDLAAADESLGGDDMVIDVHTHYIADRPISPQMSRQNLELYRSLMPDWLDGLEGVDVKLVCTHKGISFGSETGSPRDIGPAAAAFPDIDFVVYHSGYEIPGDGVRPEGPWAPETAETPETGVNRLLISLRDAGIAPGSNVHVELGTTWFCLVRLPHQAAHVLGTLLLAVGENNVIWGSDGIWYDPPQPLVDAFRAFQIPAEFRERYGYPELTPETKAKILGRNAARVYGIDPTAAKAHAANDDLAWVKAAVREYRAKGVPRALSVTGT